LASDALEELPGLRRALDEIRSERVRGAAWAAFRAARGIIEDVEAGRDPCSDPQAVAGAVEAANPSMASLANVALVVREACGRGALDQALRRLVGYLARSRERLGEAARRVRVSGTLVTISYSSTVEAAILAWRGDGVRVVVAESRPGGEGVELARRLRSAGVPVRVTPDLAAHLAMPGSAALVFGADTVTRDGCIINKVGTRLLALAAREHGVPAIAVFEPYKIHPSRACGEVPLERWTISIEGWGQESVPVFDETPPSLVRAALTSEGLAEWGARAAVEAERLHRLFVEYVLG